MSDPWGTPTAQQPGAAAQGNRKSSLGGIIALVIGAILVIGGGIAKLTTVPTSEVTQIEEGQIINFGPFEQWAPIAAIALGLVLIFLALKALNKARGRKGLS